MARTRNWLCRLGKWTWRKIHCRYKASVPGSVPEALAGVRRTGVRPPPLREIDVSPVPLHSSPPFTDHYDQAVYHAARNLTPVGRIAFDLDDTLLLNSHTLKNAWHPSPGADENGQEQVECAFLPGAFALLNGLRDAGNELALITTSSRRRLEHLLSRLPLLLELFTPQDTSTRVSPLIVTAEEIVDAQHRLPSLRPDPATISIPQKTPALATALLGHPGYDLIIDDSTEVAGILVAIGAFEKLIPVCTTELDAPTAWEIIESIARVINQRSRPSLPPIPIKPTQRLPDPFFLSDLCCLHKLHVGQEIKEYTQRDASD